VDALEAHPQAGFVFCPAVFLVEGVESTTRGRFGPTDRSVSGADCLKRLARGNFIPAPAAMARTAYYRDAGLFPLDFPYCADWYMWSVFALRGQVVYLAEPMINRRLHDSNLSWHFLERPREMVAEMIALRWRILRLARSAGRSDLTRVWLREIANDYAWRVRRKLDEDWPLGLTPDELEASLREHAASPRERSITLNAVHTAVGDAHHERREVGPARRHYARALVANPRDLRTAVKYSLARMGCPARRLREALNRVRG